MNTTPMNTNTQQKPKYVVCIDNGHGFNTNGKHSPDNKLYEWRWTRQTARILQQKLKEKGIDARLVTTEDIDISLSERCRRVNKVYTEVGKNNCICVSIHNDAARSDGQWHPTARGCSVYVSQLNASNNSKRLAKDIVDVILERGHRGNRSVPSCHYWEKNLKILRDTNCPAVLVENHFMDNRLDCEYLLTPESNEEMAETMCIGICNYFGL